MRYINQNAAAMRTAQAAYDNMLPPDDPPEPPNMDEDISALMRGEDTELVSFEQFRECAYENLYDYIDIMLELIMTCGTSANPALVERTKVVRTELEHLAGTMLDEVWYVQTGE